MNQDRDDKPTLLMIPGHLCDDRIFDRIAPALASSARLRMAEPPLAESIDAMAAELLEDTPGAFAVAGQHLGGMIALAMAAQAPDRVLGLALIDTDAQEARDSEAAYRHQLLQAAERGGLGVYVDALVANYFAHGGAGPARFGSDLRDMAIEAAPDRLHSEALALSQRRDRIDDLSAFEKPTLVVVGSEDRICPPRMARTMAAAAPRATLLEAPRTGHMAILEASVATAQAMNEWLGALATPDE